MVNRFNKAPQKPHLDTMKHIFQYVKRTLDLALCYRQGKKNTLINFSNVDWAGNQSNQKSTSGYVFLHKSTLVMWQTRKQETVACSSSESKYVALSNYAHKATWLRCLLSELKVVSSFASDPSALFCDNIVQSKSSNCPKKPIFYTKMKHIEIKFRYTRKQVESGEIS